jgi:hypothetical protein
VVRRTQRMTAAQLRLLLVFALELFADAVEELDVALIRVLAQTCDEGPGHGAGSFAANRRVGTVILSATIPIIHRIPASLNWGMELTKSVCP